jgi:carbon storage regulator
MLVLSRKLGEKIIIGDGIELMVVAVAGNRVRLGIAAPADCRILRAECHVAEPKLAPVPAKRELVAGCGV